MRYKRFFRLISVILLLAVIFSCAKINYRKQTINLFGEWHGKIPETSAILILKNNGYGTLEYAEFSKKYNFKYWIANDTILNIQNKNITNKYIFKIIDNKLYFFSTIKNEESTDLINEIEFVKQ